jgi:hypothetical protein
LITTDFDASIDGEAPAQAEARKVHLMEVLDTILLFFGKHPYSPDKLLDNN